MPERSFTIGLISDTHGLLRPQALDTLRGADFLVHAGDIGSPDILASLAEMAPLSAVRGNNDVAEWAAQVPLQATLSVGALRILVIHERQHLNGQSLPDGTSAVIYGHSHRPVIDVQDGVLYINPGSAGPRRFNLPVTVALLRVMGEKLNAEIIALL